MLASCGSVPGSHALGAIDTLLGCGPILDFRFALSTSATGGLLLELLSESLSTLPCVDGFRPPPGVESFLCHSGSLVNATDVEEAFLCDILSEEEE